MIMPVACYAGVHTKIGRVIIGNNVFIGAGATVLCNTKIGDNVIVGAGSVVTHDIPSNSICAGNPAEVICSYEEWSRKHKEFSRTRPYFNQRRWDDWSNASLEEWENMRQQLESGFGYV